MGGHGCPIKAGNSLATVFLSPHSSDGWESVGPHRRIGDDLSVVESRRKRSPKVARQDERN